MPKPRKAKPAPQSTEAETVEIRKCTDCGEEWIDGGSYTCPHCQSDMTEIDRTEERPVKIISAAPRR